MMETPVCEFVRRYAESGISRFHMPGHKGSELLGFEKWDITEIRGADSLYEADDIISRSEEIASSLFGTAATFYSTEGSSLCIRAMLYLLLTLRRNGASGTIVAARNAHRTFIYAAALLDFEIVWLTPEDGINHLCSCIITPQRLEGELNRLDAPPAAVFVTSPDYLGCMQDIKALAEVCHNHGTYLAVDNAHGAYLKFLPESLHPIDLGADICCDSAHKTLPAVTGSAYLHLAAALPVDFKENARQALGMFGSTSPSYLIMASLDYCNSIISGEYITRLSEFIPAVEKAKEALRANGRTVISSDPLRITIKAGGGETGVSLAEKLRAANIEPEFCDEDYLVMMLTPYNVKSQLDAMISSLGKGIIRSGSGILSARLPKRVMSTHEAMMGRKQKLAVKDSIGRICADPSVSCPPAVPVIMPGEEINEEIIALMHHYGMENIWVINNNKW